MKVYSPPKAVGDCPELDYTKDIRTELKKEEDWVKKIKDWAKAHGKGPHRGKEVCFGVADGNARYVILDSTKLIHLPVGDAWQFQYIERLKYSDIVWRIV